MKFTPKKESELQAAKVLLPKGQYAFKVTHAIEKKSKKSEDMICLSLVVYDNQGDEFDIRDWLLESASFKLSHFCKCVGLYDQYEMGELEDYMCEGKTGLLKLVISKGSQKPDGSGNYPDQNTVSDYLTKDSKKPSDEDDSFLGL